MISFAILKLLLSFRTSRTNTFSFVISCNDPSILSVSRVGQIFSYQCCATSNTYLMSKSSEFTAV